MTPLVRFWRQPCRRYRNFYIVFWLLALNFLVPGLSYTLAPEAALESFGAVNRLLGGDPLGAAEADSRFWRHLGAGNVVTLGVMCLLLLRDLRRFYPVLVPLVFMKAWVAVSWLGAWMVTPGVRLFLAAGLFDVVTLGLFLGFALPARAALRRADDATLVPRPPTPER